jgi:predicted nucleic acid-binding protein
VFPGDQVKSGSAPPLPDPDDEVFLAAALMTPDQVLVTGNAVHFPRDLCATVQVLSPAEALERIITSE